MGTSLVALSLRPRTAVSAMLFLAVAACGDTTGSDGQLDPSGASYSVEYSPPLAVANAPCDRLLSYAILSLGPSEFSLSVNLMDDCTNVGGVWDYWEVYIEGQYTVADTILNFTPEANSTPSFTGSFDADYVRVVLPMRSDSLASRPVTVELGPRAPF